MGKVVALFGLLVLGCDFCAAESLKPRFQAILNAAVDEGLMAVSAHVSWEDGSWTGVAGKSTADTRAALDSNSLFRLASLTKLFTATVILQLIDEEKVHLDDILTDILPGHPVSDIPHGDFITIRMLLDHTSGIRSFSESNGFSREAYGNGGLDRVWEPEELIRFALKKKPHFAPGVEGEKKYSNSNYILLGMIIEKVTGKSLARVYRGRIYEPVGPENSSAFVFRVVLLASRSDGAMVDTFLKCASFR